jgi:hypothetical protein
MPPISQDELTNHWVRTSEHAVRQVSRRGSRRRLLTRVRYPGRLDRVKLKGCRPVFLIIAGGYHSRRRRSDGECVGKGSRFARRRRVHSVLIDLRVPPSASCFGARSCSDVAASNRGVMCDDGAF